MTKQSTVTDIYNQFDTAFRNVSAIAILANCAGEITPIGKICFKFPKDGASRLTCFFHIYGTKMTKGIASGYGYDKKTAAVQDAISKIEFEGKNSIIDNRRLTTMQVAMENAESKGFDAALREAGFTLVTLM